MVAAPRASRTAATSSRSRSRRACDLGGNESYPDEFQPFGGFADDTPVEDGTVAPCEAPGIGIERKAALHAVLAETLRRGSSSRA